MIYVDEPKEYDVRGTVLKSPFWSHMWSSGNDVAELLAFADKLGLRREWLQDKPRRRWRLPHFDVIPSKRVKALKLGAQPKELRDFLRENGGDYPPVIELKAEAGLCQS